MTDACPTLRCGDSTRKSDGMTVFWAALLKPFALAAFLCVLAVIRVLLFKWLPNSIVKRLLLRKLW